MKKIYTTTHKFKAGDRVKIIQAGRGCASTSIGQTVTIKSLERPYMSGIPGYSIVERNPYWNTTVIGEDSFELVPPTRSICKQDILDLMYTTLISVDGRGTLFVGNDKENLLLTAMDETLAKNNIKKIYDEWKENLK